MVPEIWSAKDRISTIFCPLPPPHLNNPENQNFEKIKKMPGEIIILHKCTINKNGKYICIYVIYMYFTKYTENKVFSCYSPCL